MPQLPRSQTILPLGIERRFFVHDDKELWFDPSSWRFIVEELIAIGASSVIVDADTPFASAIETLPDALKKRTLLADQDKELLTHAATIIRPIANELRVDPEILKDRPYLPESSMDDHIRAEPNKEVRDQLVCLTETFWALYSMLLAIKHDATMQLDLARIVGCLQWLRQQLCTHDATAAAAVLHGLLTKYAEHEVNGIKLAVSNDNGEVQDILEELWSESEMQEISYGWRMLGARKHVRRTIDKISKWCRYLTRKPKYNKALELVTRTVGAASGLGSGLSSSTLVDALAASSYSPPIISLTSSVMSARDLWERRSNHQTSMLLCSLDVPLPFESPRAGIIFPANIHFVRSGPDDFELSFSPLTFVSPEEAHVVASSKAFAEPELLSLFRSLPERVLCVPIRCDTHGQDVSRAELKSEIVGTDLHLRVKACCLDAAHRAIVIAVGAPDPGSGAQSHTCCECGSHAPDS